jgi:Phage integrase, N-terminal SAM-like domain
MSTDAVSPLRQRMIDDMNARKLGAHTQRSHIYSCKRFAAFLKRSLVTATHEDIRLFQRHLADTSMSICNRNRIMTGLRFLFRVTLRRSQIRLAERHRPLPLSSLPQLAFAALVKKGTIAARLKLGGLAGQRAMTFSGTAAGTHDITDIPVTSKPRGLQRRIRFSHWSRGSRTATARQPTLDVR